MLGRAKIYNIIHNNVKGVLVDSGQWTFTATPSTKVHYRPLPLAPRPSPLSLAPRLSPLAPRPYLSPLAQLH